MIALARKEMREHALWALLALAVMSAALAQALYSDGHRGRFAGMLSDEVQLVTLFGGLLGGAALGLLQTLRERRRDAWALLTHRPATRTALFGGKVLGGMVLYWTALGLPVLAAGWWAATPGNVPSPFFAAMLLPALADLLAGVAFYFAGMLVALREARWWCSRLLPLVAAVLALAVAHAAIAALAFGAVLLCVAVLAIGAWDAFRASGQYGAQRGLGRTMVGVTLAAAILSLIGATFGILDEFTHSRSYSSYDIDRSGRVVRNWYDVDGEHTEVVAAWGTLTSAAADALLMAGVRGSLQECPLTDYSTYDLFRLNEQFYTEVSTGRSARWYFVRGERLLEGYSYADRRLVGVIGPGGYAAVGAPRPAPFDEDIATFWGVSGNMLVLPHAVFALGDDVALECVYRSADDERICGVVRPAPLARPAAMPYAVVTTRQVVVLGPDQRVVARWPHPASVTSDWIVGVALMVVPASEAESDEGIIDTRLDSAVLVYSPPFRARSPVLAVRQTLADGQTQSVELPRLNEPTQMLHVFDVAAAGVVPPGVAPLMVIIAAVDTLWHTGSGPSTWANLWAPARSEPGRFAALAGLLLAQLLLTVGLTRWLSRRYAFARRERILWLILTALGGVSAVLTLLALRAWPARVTCPACGRRRVVTRELCEHCGAAFVPSPPDGTEILESAALFAVTPSAAATSA